MSRPLQSSAARRAGRLLTDVLFVVVGIGLAAWGTSSVLTSADVRLRCDRATDTCRYESSALATSTDRTFAARTLAGASSFGGGPKTPPMLYVFVGTRPDALERIEAGRSTEARAIAEHIGSFVALQRDALDESLPNRNGGIVGGLISLGIAAAAVGLGVGDVVRRRREQRRQAIRATRRRPATIPPPDPGVEIAPDPTLAPLATAVATRLGEPVSAIGAFTPSHGTRRATGWPKAVAVALTPTHVAVVEVVLGRPIWPRGDLAVGPVLGCWERATVEAEVEDPEVVSRTLLLRVPGRPDLELVDAGHRGRAPYNTALLVALAPDAVRPG
ncbi:MAG: hypothetical protein U0Q07_14715 [Acidimicrobiales bacterium]